VVIHDSGACPGVMPAAPTCETQIAACDGLTATHATSDAKGSLALFCSTQDITPSPGYSMYSPGDATFTKGAVLGDSAYGTTSGFLAVSHSVNGTPAPQWEFFTDAGAASASYDQGTGAAFVGPAGVEVATVANGSLVVQRYGFDGSPRGAAQVAGDASGSVLLGGATDVNGHTLIIWGAYGVQGVSARWFAPDGTPETAMFSLSGWGQNIGASAALPGGGVAVGGNVGSRWRSIVAEASISETDAPDWLANRDDGFALVLGNRAMAFGSEIVAPDGTSCGTIDFGAPLLGIGVDGSAIASSDGKIVSVYPGFLK
jgi:hypothetical protein